MEAKYSLHQQLEDLCLTY